MKMNLSLLRQWLTFLNPTPSNEDDNNIKNNFEPSKRLCERDYVIVGKHYVVRY